MTLLPALGLLILIHILSSESLHRCQLLSHRWNLSRLLQHRKFSSIFALKYFVSSTWFILYLIVSSFTLNRREPTQMPTDPPLTAVTETPTPYVLACCSYIGCSTMSQTCVHVDFICKQSTNGVCQYPVSDIQDKLQFNRDTNTSWIDLQRKFQEQDENW